MLEETLLFLWKLVCRRRFLLSLNEDEPAALVKVEGWFDEWLQMAEMGEFRSVYTEWEAHHTIIPFDPAPGLDQSFLSEHVGSILAY